jgi:hypothetical protein
MANAYIDSVPHLPSRCQRDNENATVNVKQKLEEELSIVEADTIIDPRTVVIHVEDASIAYATVVCAIRLPYVAHLAIPPSLRFIAHVKAPVWRYNSWICHNALIERSAQIDKEQVVDEEYAEIHRISHFWPVHQEYINTVNAKDHKYNSK